jgi:hypothetical protein
MTTYQSAKYNDNRPNVGVTVVPFIYEDNILKTLVYKRASNAEVFADQYSLPNAIFDIKKFENAEKTAEFAMSEKINLKLKHIEQIHTFSGLYIDPDRINTVNICYLSICNKEDITTLGDSKYNYSWISVEKLLDMNLAFNHNEVLELAYKRLKSKAEYTALTAHMLGESFTISEFRNLIELLIEEELDNSRFRDRLKKSDVLIPLPDQFKLGSNRPAQLYKLNEDYTDYFYPKSLTKPKAKNKAS